MKYLFVSLFLLTTTIGLQAQDGIIDKVSEETCTCMSGKDLSEISVEAFEQEIGLCLMNIAAKYSAELEAAGYDISDQNSVSKLGEQVGQQIAFNCPDVFQKMMELYGQEESTQTQVRQLARYRGTFVNMQATGPFAVLTLQDVDGSQATFLWLEYFPGSEMFLQGTDSLKDLMLTVTYETRELFQPETGAYQAFQVINRVDKG